MRLTTTGTAAALLLATSTVGIAGAAWAADPASPDLTPGPLLAQAPPPPPAMMYGVDWTGFYVGADAGGGWSNQRYNTFLPSAAPSGAANSLIAAPFDGSIGWPTSLSGTSTGFTGGGHIGYNWQLPNTLVIGVEGDAQYLGGSVTNNSTFTSSNNGIVGAAGGTGTINNSLSASTPWFVTLRGRIGTTALNPNLLLYATGGYGFARQDVSNTMTVTSGGALVERFPFSYNSVRGGYVAGAGAEWMLNPQWTIKAEYLHLDLSAGGGGSQISSTTVLGARALPNDTMGLMTRNPTLDIARVGISYHFGAPPPPPPAPVAMPAPPPAAPRVFIVFFDWDKDVITPEGQQIIQQAADAYRSGAPVQLQVTGYTDRSGSPGYNQRLSERRANNVARALAALGVPKNEMVVSGRGENDNRVPTAPGVREPQNRRVEIVAP